MDSPITALLLQVLHGGHVLIGIHPRGRKELSDLNACCTWSARVSSLSSGIAVPLEQLVAETRAPATPGRSGVAAAARSAAPPATPPAATAAACDVHPPSTPYLANLQPPRPTLTSLLPSPNSVTLTLMKKLGMLSRLMNPSRKCLTTCSVPNQALKAGTCSE